MLALALPSFRVPPWVYSRSPTVDGDHSLIATRLEHRPHQQRKVVTLTRRQLSTTDEHLPWLSTVERCDPGAVLLASAEAFTDTRTSIIRLELHFQAGVTAHQRGSSAHVTVRHFQGSGTCLHIRA
jgi:hypothetical protein